VYNLRPQRIRGRVLREIQQITLIGCERTHLCHGFCIKECYIRQSHDQVHVLGEWNKEKEGADGNHVSPIRNIDCGLGWCKRVCYPSADHFPCWMRIFTCFDDVGGCTNCHDEEKNNIPFKLRFPFQFFWSEQHTSIQCEKTANQCTRVSKLNHSVPNTVQGLR